MSEKFLQKDTIPGLVPDKLLMKYKREESSKQRARQNKTPSLKVKEADNRNEKLNTALDESNKGFSLLSKMGYKKGMGLGKEGGGRTEPIPLEIKKDVRSGLGKEELERKRKLHREEAFVILSKRRREAVAALRSDFQTRQRDRANERTVESDLRKSQLACEQLDQAKGIEAVDHWYWPAPPAIEEEEDEEVEDDEELEQPDVYTQLDVLTHYLRMTYLYCIWCGTTYTDEDDFNANCPGDSHAAHDEG